MQLLCLIKMQLLIGDAPSVADLKDSLISLSNMMGVYVCRSHFGEIEWEESSDIDWTDV